MQIVLRNHSDGGGVLPVLLGVDFCSVLQQKSADAGVAFLSGVEKGGFTAADAVKSQRGNTLHNQIQ